MWILSEFREEGEFRKLMSGYSWAQGGEGETRRADIDIQSINMQILWCTKSCVQLWILSYSRHGVWVEGTSIHDETWSGHLPSETEIPSHFLTRPKVHLRLLIEWKLQMRKMIQLEMENESGNWALPDIWLMSATPSPRFTSSAFLDCHPPSLLFQNQVCHQAPPQYHISQKSPIFQVLRAFIDCYTC